MKIIVFSDNHGDLPEITTPCDVVIIAGDISPLNIQRNYSKMCAWLEQTFVPWAKYLPCDKVIVIAGNHDFVFENSNWKMDCPNLAYSSKIKYLEDEEYVYNGKTFYGCPYSTIPGWAFSTYSGVNTYNNIAPDVDILITHQPPRVKDIGTSNIGTAWERNFGSVELAAIIATRKPKYLFCGHIHSGDHNLTTYGDTKMYNVSLKDEDYKISYKPLEIEID